jgi:hypothetical protein
MHSTVGLYSFISGVVFKVGLKPSVERINLGTAAWQPIPGSRVCDGEDPLKGF